MVHQFGETDMEVQMRVKDVFDPAWLLNPAKVFPMHLSHGRRNRNRARAA
jgi:glycolate oxidase